MVCVPPCRTLINPTVCPHSVSISEQRLLFRYEALIGFYIGDGVFTARYELNL